MPYRGTDYDGALKVIYFAAASTLIASVIFLRPTPKPNPINARVFGCYSTASAAPILLDANGMHVLQSGFSRIGYRLERGKAGIALTAERPIVARPAGGRYFYSIEQPGEGRYLNFFKVINGRTYGVFDEEQLTQFTMLADDGTYLPYRMVGDSHCQSGQLTSRR